VAVLLREKGGDKRKQDNQGFLSPPGLALTQQLVQKEEIELIPEVNSPLVAPEMTE